MWWCNCIWIIVFNLMWEVFKWFIPIFDKIYILLRFMRSVGKDNSDKLLKVVNFIVRSFGSFV